MIRTAESVSPRHPDKICDRISDAILDECLRQDPMSRVAVETMGGHGIVTVTGELTTNAFVDIPAIVKRIVPNVGVQVNLVKQSNEIAQGVDKGGAGDQGIMVGYACNETPELMPLEYQLARDLCRFIYERYPYDGKTQVTVNDDGIQAIVASFQNVGTLLLEEIVFDWLKGRSCGRMFLNEAGDWSVGGFDADTGLTGRKIVVDAYGSRVPVGGGAFSGKDPTKVDRSGAYMARALSVKFLKQFHAEEVYCYLAYVIGKPEPLQATLIVNGQEQGVIAGEDLRPESIIRELDLRQPIYEDTAMWGHFGNGFTWDEYL